MEKRLDAMKRITLAAAACLALASCGSLQPDEVVIAGSPTGQTVTIPESSSDETSTSSTPTTEAPTTEAPAPTEAPTTTEATTTTEAAIAAPSSTTDAGDGEVAVLGAAQVQDDDEEEDGAVQELPRTGANEVMLLIAIGCAMIVGGRSLIDLVNAIARAIQRSVPPRPAPPR